MAEIIRIPVLANSLLNIAITLASKLGEGGAVRKGGKIIRKPLGQKGMWVDFGLKKLFVMSIPWGDISTANFTTGIPATFDNTKKLLFYKIQHWVFMNNFMAIYN